MNLKKKFLLLIISAAVPLCLSDHSLQEITSYEDRTVTLSYYFHDPANVNECTYSLTFDTVLFNNNGTFITSDIYTPDKQQRSRLNAKRIFQSFQVTLELNNINKSDAGVYGCYFQCGVTESSQSYLLQIYHPPKPADCNWVSTAEDPSLDLGQYNLSILFCSATNGHPTSAIICFSQHNQITSVHAPKQLTGVEVIEAKFWLSRDVHIRCCSMYPLYQKNWDSCKDYETISPSHLPTPVSDSGLIKEVNDIKTATTEPFPEKVTISPIVKFGTNNSSGIASRAIFSIAHAILVLPVLIALLGIVFDFSSI
ncbi:uncharacterized protein LOC129259373 [Lytechinus pictus]|uniref:uncharacterized protein LOC129259373 n=1 Tax=Lytechinus pictus TaxID=7653 RepID=UPI0030B9AE6E